jgi:hypothetical protein
MMLASVGPVACGCNILSYYWGACEIKNLAGCQREDWRSYSVWVRREIFLCVD